MAANKGTTYVYNSVVSGNSALNGTFNWTTPNPPTPGSLGGTYTLTSDPNSSLTMTGVNVTGEHVTFTITAGAVVGVFSGNFNNGNNNFTGTCHVTTPAQVEDDTWTASAQG